MRRVPRRLSSRNARRFAGPVVAALLLCNMSGDACAAKIQGDLSLFDVVAQAHRANKGAIRSWTGQVEVVDERSSDVEEPAKWRSRAAYAYRAVPYGLCWTWEILHPKAGERVLSTLKASNGLIEDGKLVVFELQGVPGRQDPVRSVRIVRPSSMKGPRRTAFDPMYWMGYRGTDVAEYFSYFGNHSNEEIDEEALITRDGEIVTFSIRSPDVTNKYVVDLSKGGNVISYEGEDRVGAVPFRREAWTWSYEVKQGLWLPTEVTFGHESWKDSENGRERIRTVALRGIRWLESRVNAGVSDDEISLETIGLVPGDIISDTLTGNFIEYGPSQTKQERWRLALIMANAALVIAIASWLWRRRARNNL